MEFLKLSTGGIRRLATALAGVAAVLVLLSGCGLFSLQTAAPDKTAEGEDDLLRKQRFRTRPPIRTARNLYEGGLWRGAASWGNLMRDHRARFAGDLLTELTPRLRQKNGQGCLIAAYSFLNEL